MRRRVEVADTYVEFSNLHEYFDALGITGHSDDDSDEEHPGRVVYHIRRLSWRSQKLTKYLHNLDILSIASKYSDAGRPLPGAFPRERIANNNREEFVAKPVPDLPRAFYDKDWLKRLTPQERDRLRIKEVDVNLDFPASLEPYVAFVLLESIADYLHSIIRRFAHVKNHNQVPLPA